MTGICTKFNNVSFHDSKLKTFTLLRRCFEDGLIVEDFCLELELLIDHRPGHYKWSKRYLIFKDCKTISMDLDLQEKQLCADSIMSAICQEYSGDEFLHFRVVLVPAGGEINIYAKDFDITEEPTPSSPFPQNP